MSQTQAEPRPAAKGEPLVVLDGVNKWFGELHVLQDINLSIKRGEVVVVIGPSGSGKSTLCRAINRLETIDKGSITLDGVALPQEGKELAHLRAEVGMVFQSFNLFAHKTILENVTLGPIKVRKHKKADADQRGMELLERVGIEQQAQKYPAQLSGGQVDVNVEAAPDLTGAAKELSDAGKIKIGVKKDQPGIGFQAPGADAPEGFDIEMGRIIAAKLGISDDNIDWVETVSDNREPFLQNGTVDLVLASYSITDDRRKVVGQAGPYYLTGQQLLVRKDGEKDIQGPEDLADAKVCSVSGSTSLQRVEDEYGAKPAPFATYSECVEQLLNQTVDAVTTDGAILLGYAADHPDELEVVGEPFSEERYGVGYNKDAEGMCDFINETLQESFDDGTWGDAFQATLGVSGVDTPETPELDPCQ